MLGVNGRRIKDPTYRQCQINRIRVRQLLSECFMGKPALAKCIAPDGRVLEEFRDTAEEAWANRGTLREAYWRACAWAHTVRDFVRR